MVIGMKTYIRVMFVLGYTLATLALGYSFIMLCLYNGIFNFFDFKQQEGRILEVKELKKNSIMIDYEYKVNNELFHNNIRVFRKLFDEHIQGKNVVVYYNSKFPQISYINNIKLLAKYYISIAFFTLMLILLILLDRFADKEKWILRYKRLFERL